MRILFLSDNFPPEGNAPATRLHEHALRWVRAGHDVTVVTCAPNFPEGRLFPGYANRWRDLPTLIQALSTRPDLVDGPAIVGEHQ